MMDRRAFLQSLSTAPLWNGLNRSIAERSGRVGDGLQTIPSAAGRKAVLISMLPKDLPYAARFKAARDAGFDAIEMQTIARGDEAAEIRDAAIKAGLRIHSVMNADHWPFTLSSSERTDV